MRFYNFINEDKIQDALDLPEPKVNQDYPDEKVKRYLEIIDSALSKMKNKEENDTNDAIVADLRDKRKKWSNIGKETKAVKIKTEQQPEQQEEQPEPEQQEESKIKKYFSNKIEEDHKTQKRFEKLMKDFKAGKITKEEMLKKMKGK